MDNTAENNRKNISYTNLYSGLLKEVYYKLYNRFTQKETENDYAMVLFSFTHLVNQLINEEIPDKDFNDALKAVAIMRIYLFPILCHIWNIRKR